MFSTIWHDKHETGLFVCAHTRTIIALERTVDSESHALPHAHAARIVHLDGVLLVVVPPVLVALEKERAIVVAPHQGRVDLLQVRGQAQSRQRPRVAHLQRVGVETEVLAACGAGNKWSGLVPIT